MLNLPVHADLLIATVAAFIGVFLNWLVTELPARMMREWKAECHDFLGLPVPESTTALRLPKIGFKPSCKQCGRRLRFQDCIPIVGYFTLRGRCPDCHHPISRRYPFVEILSAVSAVVAFHFWGLTWAGLAAAVFLWALIVLGTIDVETQLLPDQVTQLLLWLGLVLNVKTVFVDIESAVLGAVAGYLVLWIVYWLFKLSTGKEGMGYGDMKLLAALGAWLGWQQIPVMILMASLLCAGVSAVGIFRGQQDRYARIPFGPYLALAGGLSLLGYGTPFG